MHTELMHDLYGGTAKLVLGADGGRACAIGPERPLVPAYAFVGSLAAVGLYGLSRGGLPMLTNRETVVDKAALLVKCPICAKRVRAASIRAHLKGLHPNLQAKLQRSIVRVFEPRNSLVSRVVAKSTKRKSGRKVVRKETVSTPCRICGLPVPKGGTRQHRVKFHGAHPRVLGVRVTKKDVAPFVTNNMAKPWHGGGPGTGKRS